MARLATTTLLDGAQGGDPMGLTPVAPNHVSGERQLKAQAAANAVHLRVRGCIDFYQEMDAAGLWQNPLGD